jgi:vacuolar protein sorting-associated protein 13A/C
MVIFVRIQFDYPIFRARNWWYGDSKPKKKTKNSDDIVAKFERTMNPKEKLYEAIDYQENLPPTDYPKTFVENRFKANIGQILLRFEGSLELQFKSIGSLFEQRPSARAMRYIF